MSILIDSGSTHNFLDPALLTMVHLLVVSTPLLTVKIANGDTIPCCGKVTAVTLKSQGHPIIADFYLISLGGCDIVLGVQWLQTLGPILWDFSLMTMQYSCQGSPTLLRGLGSTALSLIDGCHFLKPHSTANKGFFFLLKLISVDTTTASPPLPTGHSIPSHHL
jgi:hypothetical protein